MKKLPQSIEDAVKTMQERASNNLRELLSISKKQDNLSRHEVASEMGVADGTLGKIRKGDGNPTLEVITRIAHYYGITPAEFLQPMGEQLPTGSVKIAPLREDSDGVELHFPARRIIGNDSLVGDVSLSGLRLASFVATDNSMAPTIRQGDICIVDASINFFDGDKLYLIERDSGAPQIRHVSETPAGDYILSSGAFLHSETVKREHVQIVGRVTRALSCINLPE